MASSPYEAGKKTGSTRTTYDMGKSTPKNTPKLTRDPKADNTMNRKGDAKGAPAMGKGK